MCLRSAHCVRTRVRACSKNTCFNHIKWCTTLGHSKSIYIYYLLENAPNSMSHFPQKLIYFRIDSNNQAKSNGDKCMENHLTILKSTITVFSSINFTLHRYLDTGCDWPKVSALELISRYRVWTHYYVALLLLLVSWHALQNTTHFNWRPCITTIIIALVWHSIPLFLNKHGSL